MSDVGNKVAVIAGSTGLIGRECLRRLLDHPGYGRVVALVRSGQAISHPKYEELIVRFDGLGSVPMVPADVAFCALGTTIQKAGSKDAFYAVDHDAVANFAYWSRGGGAEVFSVVSSVGANEASGNFYLATKGDMERAVAEQRFPRVRIFRPGILLGDRAEQRVGEKIAAKLTVAFAPLLAGPFRKYRAIPANSVAAAMVQTADEGGPGTEVLFHDAIVEAARRSAAPSATR